MEFEHNGQKYVFANALEEVVFENVRSAIARDGEMCKCAKCYYDVCAVALNSLGASKYVTSSQGSLMSKAAVSGMRESGIMSVEIIKAINLVKCSPNH